MKPYINELRKIFECPVCMDISALVKVLDCGLKEFITFI